MFEQQFAFSLVVFLFTCGNFSLILTVFWIGFLLTCFPNPFIDHYRPSFLFVPNFHFSLVAFCSHAAFWHWFSVFLSKFFRNGFPNSLIVRSRSSFFVYSMKIFWIVRQDLSCYVFLFRRLDFCYDHMTSQSAFCSFVHAVSTELRAWRHFSLLSGASFFVFICVIKFLVTRDLPHSQKWLHHFRIDFFFTLTQRDKVKWVYITLIEVYLRAANRSSNKLYRFLIKISKSP